MARACIFAPGDTWPILVRGERRGEGEGLLALGEGLLALGEGLLALASSCG